MTGRRAHYPADDNGRYDVQIIATDRASNQSARHVHVYGCHAGAVEEGYVPECPGEEEAIAAAEASPDDDEGSDLIDEPASSGTTATASTSESVRIIKPRGGQWATIRHYGHGFTVGYAKENDTIVTNGSHLGYFVGRISGSNGNWNQGCGWLYIKSTSSPVGPGNTNCSEAFRPSRRQFMKRVNCKSCTFAHGSRISPLRETTMCANLTSIYDAEPKTCRRTLRTITTSDRLGWRYVTRDGGWVMVSLGDSVPNNQGRWGFVRKSDLPRLPR